MPSSAPVTVPVEATMILASSELKTYTPRGVWQSLSNEPSSGQESQHSRRTLEARLDAVVAAGDGAGCGHGDLGVV